MSDSAVRVHLSLISHTNAGKTTLARTLLGRDVGEVRDAAHVTEFAERYTLIELEDGTALMLWDTPGFGDTARLLRRLRHADNPLGWFLTQVWDRFRDRPFWCSQQAIRNARDEADVVLYLVNAAEDPRDAGYVAMEMQILERIRKPVVLLLNQMGPPRPTSEEAAQAERWRAHLAQFTIVRDALPLDAFARCWVQEDALLRVLDALVPAEKQSAFARLAHAWEDKNLERFDRAMAALAAQLGRSIGDREVLAKKTLTEQARAFVRALGLGSAGGPTDRERAMGALAERLDADIRTTTDTLIALHGLEGRAAAEVLRRLQENYTATQPLSEGRAAVLGGVATGALTGLKADLAAGGFTFGAGALAGAIVGALGAAGLARGYNLVRGESHTSMRWSLEFVVSLTRSALLRYLAVAHYGRGRGDYVRSEYPEFWQSAVAEIIERRRAEIASLWERAKTGTDARELIDPMQGVLATAAAEVLERLYPGEVFLTRRRAD